MPRRKRSTVQSERRRKVCRRENNNDQEEEEEEDNTLVISDSDSGEEEEDRAKKVSPRAARRLEREKKAHVQDMTEEEMLDLALRLSKQEANCATQREQVEDDDMRKAMAESLQFGCSQASETSFRRVRSAPKPHQDRDAVSPHVRCKLSFSSKDKEAGVSKDDVPNAQASALKSSEEDGALLPMPDLSQRTLSQPSPPSPTLPSVPSAASLESCSSRLAKQEHNAHRPEDASSQSDAPLEVSPVLIRHCTVRLNQKVLSSSRSSRISAHTTNSALGSTSPNTKSQSSPPPPKSPVFPKTDLKRCTQLTRGKFSDSHSSRSDGVRKPEDAFQESPSHKRRDSPKRLSRGRKAQSSSHVSASEDDSQEAGKGKEQAKEESSRGTGLRTVSDRTPTLDTSSPADGCPTDGLISHMVLLLSDDDDEDDDDKIIYQSPIFPQGRASCAGKPKRSPTQLCSSSPSAITTPDSNHTKSSSQLQSEQPNVSRKSSDSRLSSAAEGKDIGVVSYFWGVPFCPKGQSPDDYTRVILTQLEVYEKSLKEAQRRLLHKADWGLPVFPCPVERPHGRRLKRHRAPRLLDEDEEEEEEEEEEENEDVQGCDEEEKEKKKKVERKKQEDSQSCSEEGAQNGQHETYVVVSSPGSQEELEQKSPLLLGQKESTNPAKPSSCRKLIPQDLSEDTQIQSEPDELGEEVQDGSFDMESAVCPETQMTPELMVTSPAQPNSDGMEVDEVTDPPPEADLGERMEQERPGEEQSWMESVPSQVECPMCTRLFPLSKIEVHAAYCNGAVDDQVQEQQDNLSQASARRKITRRTTEDDVTFEKSEEREKCFLCKKFFTSKEYRHHVDQCLEQKALGPKQGNGLLSALNRTETVHLDDSRAGPSNTTARNSRLADPSVTPGDSSDSQASGYYVSSSPIKSFTPISEITDCLINFRQQYSDRTSQRLGRKRKFKR